MFKKHYYCLIAGLPDLILNESRKGLTSLQFRLELAEMLSKPDSNFLELLYRPIDHKNLINLLLKKDLEFDVLGNYTEEYLRTQIIEPTDIPAYMKLFINDFKSETIDKPPLRTEIKLEELFFESVLKINNDFIKRWFTFDRNIKNILTATNCHKYGYPVEKHLVSDNNSTELFQLLLKKNLRPEMFIDEHIPYLVQILRIADSTGDLSGKEKEIDAIKWAFLDEITVFNYFTIEKILSFVIKLQIVDRWRELNEDTGKAFLKKLIKDLEMSYSFDKNIA